MIDTGFRGRAPQIDATPPRRQSRVPRRDDAPPPRRRGRQASRPCQSSYFHLKFPSHQPASSLPSPPRVPGQSLQASPPSRARGEASRRLPAVAVAVFVVAAPALRPRTSPYLASPRRGQLVGRSDRAAPGHHFPTPTPRLSRHRRQPPHPSAPLPVPSSPPRCRSRSSARKRNPPAAPPRREATTLASSPRPLDGSASERSST
mmetsp:Transcript_2918/g.10235  ORF Transcript_2918/g.10235 Transcript_2918/m.10235 type:complete len:204 (+) Transcript_2918:1204-1815(+)